MCEYVVLVFCGEIERVASQPAGPETSYHRISWNCVDAVVFPFVFFCFCQMIHIGCTQAFL